MNKKISLLFMMVVTILGCSAQPQVEDRYREEKVMMGTTVKLDVCSGQHPPEKIEAAYADVWQRLEDIAWRMNVYDEQSDVSKVNQSYQNPVEVGEDTYGVLQKAIVFNRLTKGTFDITIWPLLKLWRDQEQKNKLPSREQIQQTLSALGPEQIAFKANSMVELQHPQTMVDLGGIAKGYAIDEAARIFRAYDIDQFYIDAGGDIYVGGHSCKGRPWRIGIRDPRDQSNILEVVEVVDQAVTTSGNYEQFIVINDEQWSHIINPMTGYPQKQVVSATVIGRRAEEADALATALCVLGKDTGHEIIDNLGDDYAGLIIEKAAQGRIIKYESANYQKFRSR